MYSPLAASMRGRTPAPRVQIRRLVVVESMTRRSPEGDQAISARLRGWMEVVQILLFTPGPKAQTWEEAASGSATRPRWSRPWKSVMVEGVVSVGAIVGGAGGVGYSGV